MYISYAYIHILNHKKKTSHFFHPSLTNLLLVNFFKETKKCMHIYKYNLYISLVQ